MSTDFIRIYLADDDEDDCMLFQEALKEINRPIELTIIRDGEDLMNTLEVKVPSPPSVLFLDLNMPRKSGFECLREMKQIEKFKNIPVVVFSTSADSDHIHRAFQEGASRYARKPGKFIDLKNLIEHVIRTDWKEDETHPRFEEFIIRP